MNNYNVRSASQINVIVVVLVCGAGVKDDPCREVTQYFSLDGELLATVDKWKEQEKNKNE